jgi:hypothetical protein
VIASASEYAVPEGATVTLFGSPSGLLSYEWSPEIGLSAPTNQQTDALINEISYIPFQFLMGFVRVKTQWK